MNAIRTSEKIKKPPRLHEPLRTMLLEAPKISGTYNPEQIMPHIEEQLTLADARDARMFLIWIRRMKLTYGHGTIDLRFNEFKKGLIPVTMAAAYNWAMARADKEFGR